MRDEIKEDLAGVARMNCSQGTVARFLQKG